VSSERVVRSSVSAGGGARGERVVASKAADSERVGKRTRLLLLLSPGDVACKGASLSTVCAACAPLVSPPNACCRASRLWKTCSRDFFRIKCGTTLSAPSLSKFGTKYAPLSHKLGLSQTSHRLCDSAWKCNV
jgi:hypothetical protein